MSLVRWNPFREIAAMQRMMDRMFDDSWTNMRDGFNSQALALDVHETASEYKVVTALPGVKSENIDINYLDRTLTITAEIPEPTLAEGEKAVMNERYYGKFTRSVTLAQPVETEKISAEYADGVLTLTLPKAESAKPRQIPVRPMLKGSNN
jgi:HSP20 family protein